MPVVKFLPDDVSGEVDAGTTLLEAAQKLGVAIPASCGGKGLCGKCRVRVLEGEAARDVGHERALSPAELASGWRLACLTPVEGDLVVETPAQAVRTAILTEFDASDVAPDSLVQILPVELGAPTLEDQTADMERLGRGLGRAISPQSCIEVIRSLPKVLRASDWRVYAVMQEDDLLGVAPLADGPPPVMGLAVDVGTTTVAGVLVDLVTGKNLAVASRTNPQAAHGDDVLTRIDYAARGEEETRALHRLIVETINEIAAETAEAAGVPRDGIYKIVAAGNTTMHHLLFGVSPEHIGVTPFVPVRREGMSVRARHIGVEAAPGARLYGVANISAYVGGDITAGLQAYRIHESDKAILYIDIGTNGEMALRAGGVTYACSTAAGPAFEGARISCGMRAATGAITHVGLDTDDVLVECADDAPPRGVCGTGLLDAVAAFLDAGALDETGRFPEADEIGDDVPAGIRRRLVEEDGETRFVLAEAPEPGRPRVTLTGRDIRELQLAKGAVAAGYRTLLNFAGLTDGDLDEVVLAGAFGSYLRPASAQRIGLLPSGTPLERVRFVGNAALAGARAVLLNRTERAESERLAREVRYVELSGRADFQELFMETMLFPAVRPLRGDGP